MLGRERTRPLAVGAVAGCTLALIASGVASAQSVGYPTGGATFTGSAQGWVGSAGTCAPAAGLDITCSTTTQYSATEGNPPGSINSRLDVVANAGGALRGQTTWTSPDFTLGLQPASAAFALDRRLDTTGVAALNPQSTYVVSLIDRSAGNRATTLQTETIGSADGAFARRAKSVATAGLTKGHTYALSIVTTTTTQTARVGVAGSLNTRYDNVALSVDGSAPASGLTDLGNGARGSTGVTVRSAPLADRALTRLLGTFNPNTEAGKGPGGSVVPAAKCTIVGTARNDRIKGTKGNDVICGLGGNDRIAGGGGNDVIDTGNGNDIATGSAGKDTLVGASGKDRLSGQAGADRLGGGALADRLDGGSGGDRLDGGSGNDHLNGRSGNDRLTGDGGRDRLYGSTGADRVAGGSGADRISARDRRRDRVDGGAGRDLATLDRTGHRRIRRSRADLVRHVERRR